MKNQFEVQSFEVTEIQHRIITVRNVQVMLDRDLAMLYGVEVKQLNRQVKRNIERFHSDFMFQLTKEDCLRCQIGTLNGKRGEHLKYLPYAFTENGIAMLSGVLKSPTAIEVNIRIMRAFTAMRRFVFDHAGLVQRVGAIEMKQLETDKRIDTVFDALDRGNLLLNGILPSGTEFDSLRYVSRLIEGAKSEILIIDPYSDATTLDVLAKKQPGVTVRLHYSDFANMHILQNPMNSVHTEDVARLRIPAGARPSCRVPKFPRRLDARQAQAKFHKTANNMIHENPMRALCETPVRPMEIFPKGFTRPSETFRVTDRNLSLQRPKSIAQPPQTLSLNRPKPVTSPNHIVSHTVPPRSRRDTPRPRPRARHVNRESAGLGIEQELVSKYLKVYLHLL